jgi:hypothetical protein
MNGEFYLERIWFTSGIFRVPHAHQCSVRLLKTLAWILLLLLLLSGAARSPSLLPFLLVVVRSGCVSLGSEGFGARFVCVVVVALAVIKYIKIKVSFYSCSVASFSCYRVMVSCCGMSVRILLWLFCFQFIIDFFCCGDSFFLWFSLAFCFGYNLLFWLVF